MLAASHHGTAAQRSVAAPLTTIGSERAGWATVGIALPRRAATAALQIDGVPTDPLTYQTTKVEPLIGEAKTMFAARRAQIDAARK